MASSLRQRIDREKQLPVDEALGIATAVANALQTAHEQGVIHRDIKPVGADAEPPLRQPASARADVRLVGNATRR